MYSYIRLIEKNSVGSLFPGLIFRQKVSLFRLCFGRETHTHHVSWLLRIRKFPGQTEPTMSADVELISTMGEKKSWTRPPIQMEFQVKNLLIFCWIKLNI